MRRGVLHKCRLLSIFLSMTILFGRTFDSEGAASCSRMHCGPYIREEVCMGSNQMK